MPDEITSGVPVNVTQGVPDAEVRVLPGNKITSNKDGVTYEEGQTCELSGPEAEALVLGGHVEYV